MSERESWAATPFSERRRALFDDTSLQGPTFGRAYAGLVDSWLASLLGDEPGVVLVAVGGYGRNELAPASDLDLLLVHRGRRDVGSVAQRIWYPIWDSGLQLDHSVKTVKEALAVAAGDLKAALGLIDARPVAGDLELGAELAERARAQWQRSAARWMRVLGETVATRHQRMGDVAFLLEPDLKEARGGLRDVHALRAATAAVTVLPPVDQAVLDAADTLMTARIELQRTTGKVGDRLLLQEQDRVARALGLSDADGLMQRVSAAARTISWASDDAWRRIQSWLEGPRGRAVRSDRTISVGVVVRDDQVVAEESADLGDESLILRVAAAAARAGTPISRQTLARLQAEAAAPGASWANGTRDALVDLLGAGPAAIPVFEALDQYGLLVRILPEWEPVRSRLQHNPYHRFTVDRHLLEAAAQAAGLTDRVARPDLLLVAAWLHDLGKGHEGDHTAAGTELVAGVAHRMGFGPADTEVLVALVRHHLLLAETATRRDIRDPATITQVAAALKDPLTLELLAALTEADGRATGDTAWTPWKAGLVAELVAKVRSTFAGEVPTLTEGAPEPELQELVEAAGGGLLIKVDGPRFIVVAPDRPGLFCILAGVLSLNGLEILAADAWSAQGGMALDVFHVQHALGMDPAWDRVEGDLRRALEGRVALEARLAERARTYARRGPSRARSPAAVGVNVDNEASERASVVEVRGPDAIGVLYRIARAFLELQLDIRHAKVSTLGHEVVDTFYVTTPDGGKLVDADARMQLEETLLAALTQSSGSRQNHDQLR